MEHRMNLQFLCSPNSVPPSASTRTRSHNTTPTPQAAPIPSHAPTPQFSSAPGQSSHSVRKLQAQSTTSRITTSNLVQESPASSRIRVCQPCGVVFSRKVQFLHHLLVDHSMQAYEGRTILPCSECKSAFLRNTDRSKHMQCVHSRLRPFPCPLPGCSSSFFFSKDLSKHTNTVHLRHRPFRCDTCGRSFGKREHLTSHVKRVHHRLRPFKCQVCNILLASKYNLEGHFNTVSHRAALQMANMKNKNK